MNDITLRTTLRAGDLGYLIYRHGVLYAAEQGFEPEFEAYVAEPVGKFARTCTEGERLWIAEKNGQAVGWIAIVKAKETTAQLRWFLLEPEVRGIGLGKRLMSEAIQFSQQAGYEKIIL